MSFDLNCLKLRAAVKGSVFLVSVFVLAFAQASNKSAEAERYWDVVTKRAMKIVEQLDLSDEQHAIRVRDIIASQYVDLKAAHEARDAAGDEKSVLEARLAVRDLHYRFLARLRTELAATQIEGVKDGMTYGVVPLTYRRYMDLLPDLDEEHKRWIYGALVEAREHAMDEGSSDEKHKRFGKYKGRINNYLSALGVDMKEAERTLAEKQAAKGN